MYDGDISTECGNITYSFNVLDSTGADVTTAMADVFTFNSPAPFETALAGSQYWSVTVNADADTFVAGEVYIFALTAFYVNSYTTLHTTATPFVVMEKVQLFDASAYVTIVDDYLAMADPIIQNHFFDGAALFAIVFFGFFPGIMSLG